jgi:hypothetical protein
MTQRASLEFPEDVAGERILGKCLRFPSVWLSGNFDSLLAENGAVSETADPMAAVLFGAGKWSGRTRRSEARTHLSAPLWLTSLRRPGVLELAPVKNVSRQGIKMVTQELWEPAEPVLVSSPPGLLVQGSIVYCKKLPSDDYDLGIRLDTPVGHWFETLGLGEA